MKPKSRGNGQGTAYRRGDVWEACVVVGWKPPDDPGKKPIPIKRRKSGFKTKKEALAYCPTLLAGSGLKRKEAPILAAYWETYQSGKFTQLSKSKQTAYKCAWKRLKALHDLHVDTISVNLLCSTVADACPTYYTAKDCKNLLANLFALIGAEGFASRELPSYITLPPLEEKERQAFTPEEQSALWRLYESGDRRAAIPLLMIYTGMMPGEAFALKKQNIDLKNRLIINAGLKTKTRRETPIVLAEVIVPVVEDLITTAQKSGYIWKRVDFEWYGDYYGALEAAGCRRLAPYSCRHTTATALAITEGIAPQTIKRVMRWSTSRMLDHYAHPQMADALDAVDAIKK